MGVGSNVTSVLNNNITITCFVSGLPPPEISWRKNGNALDSKGERLDIILVDLGDTAVYTCEATNLAGQASADSHVVILGKFNFICFW